MNQAIADLLTAFHDGTIDAWKGNHTQLELRISCAYLAEREKKGNEYFFLTLQDVEQFEFHFWNGQMVKEINQIIDWGLEIGYAKVDEDRVKISCHLWTKEEGHTGGELWIKASQVLLKNQDQRIMKPEELYQLSKSYWNNIKK